MLWKKPAVWALLLAVIVCTAGIICLLTDPLTLYVDKTVYEAPQYVTALVMGRTPAFRMNDETLQTKGLLTEDWSRSGELREITLTEENFDQYCRNNGYEHGWVWQTPQNLRRENAAAWYVRETSEIAPIFYYILEQNDGERYLALGYEGEMPTIRWVFLLTQRTPESSAFSGTAVHALLEQPAECVLVEPTAPDCLVFNDKEYPLDVEELSLGKYGLEQLQWATNLKRLTVTLTEPVDWALLLAIPTLEHLEIAFHGSKTDLLLADLPVSEKLTELTLTARGSFGTVVLPKTEQLKQLTVVSFGKTEKLDVSRCTGLQVLNVSAAVEQLELGLGPEKLFLDDAVFTPKMLPAAVRIREMSLTVPQDLSILKHCPQIKKLSLAVRDPALAWDLTMLKDSAVEQLSVGDCTTQMLSDLSNMEFLQILQISDRNVEDLTALTAMSSLQKLVLTVDPDQPAEVFEALRGRELGPADLDLLQQLKLNIPPQQLADFLQAGKTLVLFHDISRY